MQLTNLSLAAIRQVSNPQASIWARIWAKRRAAASISIFIFTSCRAGRAIPTSCPSWRETRVLPENLDNLYQRLRPAFDQVARRR